MNVWYHLSTIFKQRRALQIAGILTLCVALITTLFLANVTNAAPGVNQTLSFQGRLLNSQGQAVPDGFYNIQFKLYQDGTGTAAGNPNGTLKWTETHFNNGGTGGVEVKNGYMSVNLGSLNPFGSQVDWNQDTLWLSMNIAGSSAGCTSFGTYPCVADGEMLPMKRLTATPFAINSAQLGGKTAENFVQLGQGVQTDASNNTASIYLNKTGTGNLVQLQSGATDVFTVGNTGDITLGSNANKTISIAVASASTTGNSLTLAGGAGGSGSGSTGGDLVLQGGAAGGTNGNGGNVQIDAGAKTGAGAGGTIAIGSANASTITIGSVATAATQTLSIGANNTAGSTTNVTVGSGGSAAGGSTTVQAKNAVTIATNGTTRATFSDTTNTVYFGNGVSASSPNNFTLQGTNSSTAAVAGGSLTVQGGNATTGNTNGGNVVLSGGTGTGTGAQGLVVLTTPTISTVNNDANCYTGGSIVAASCSITPASVNNSSAIIVGFSTTDQTATLPDPTITTAGRIMYIMAAAGSSDFTLAMNASDTAPMSANKALSLIWNGSDWIVAGGSSSGAAQGSSSLQEAYTNGNEIMLNDSDGAFTIKNNSTTPVENPLLEVKSSTDSTILTVNEDLADGLDNVQVGDGGDTTAPTLFTVDKGTAAPSIIDQSLLGSMYYDTTLGKVQCYEAEGWGDCGDAPDYFVTLSPQYAGMVRGSNSSALFTNGFCSDTLNIGDSSSGQPDICTTGKTYNYYSITSPLGGQEVASMYVTYKLPATFDEFIPGSTSLTGRTVDSDGTTFVRYQTYRNTGSSLTACGTPVVVSDGASNAWVQGVATSTKDPANCSFSPGDSIVFKIEMTADFYGSAYASDLSFAFSNN